MLEYILKRRIKKLLRHLDEESRYSKILITKMLFFFSWPPYFAVSKSQILGIQDQERLGHEMSNLETGIRALRFPV